MDTTSEELRARVAKRVSLYHLQARTEGIFSKSYEYSKGVTFLSTEEARRADRRGEYLALSILIPLMVTLVACAGFGTSPVAGVVYTAVAVVLSRLAVGIGVRDWIGEYQRVTPAMRAAWTHLRYSFPRLTEENTPPQYLAKIQELYSEARSMLYTYEAATAASAVEGEQWEEDFLVACALAEELQKQAKEALFELHGTRREQYFSGLPSPKGMMEA